MRLDLITNISIGTALKIGSVVLELWKDREMLRFYLESRDNPRIYHNNQNIDFFKTEFDVTFTSSYILKRDI